MVEFKKFEIGKRSDYQNVPTFAAELERLKKWVEKQPGGEMHILCSPRTTHHFKQYAIITIYDPVMQHIEKYMPEAKK